MVQVLVIFSAMSTCDPGNIHDTIKLAKDAHCRISVIGLAAEVHICRQIIEVIHLPHTPVGSPVTVAAQATTSGSL